MKIITEENGSQKLYVQRLDLAILPSLLQDDDPAIAYWIGLEYLHTNNEENKQEFVLIENEQLMRFLMTSEYLLNYYDFMGYSEKELQSKVETLKAQAIRISNRQLLNQNKHKQLSLLNLIYSKKSKKYVTIPVSYQVKK